MIDILFALLILSLTLTSTYDLVVKSNKFKDKSLERASYILDKERAYEESFKTFFK